MRFIFFILFLCLNIFCFKWMYAHGEGVQIATDCRLLKTNWSNRLEAVKKDLESSPANIRLFISSLLTEKDYAVENCEMIEPMNAAEVLKRAQNGYQNDPGTFQSFEHYRAELIAQIDRINFFALKGAMLSNNDFWEISVRQTFFLGHAPFIFNNDFSRRLGVTQSVISVFIFIFLFFPATKRCKKSGLS